MMALTQQQRCLNLTAVQTAFEFYFPAKGIISYGRIVSSRLYVCLKGTCSLAGRALLSIGEKTK